MSDLRQALKMEIIDWLRSINIKDKEIWIKSLLAVKNAAYIAVDVNLNEDYSRDVKRVFAQYLKAIPQTEYSQFNYVIADNFSSQYYMTIKSFVSKYEQVLEVEREAEEKIEDELEEQRRLFFKEDYEYDEVPGEVVVYPDYILVEANGWQPQLKDNLPKGGKYEGKGCWRYSIDMKETFTKGKYYQGMPVLVVKHD